MSVKVLTSPNAVRIVFSWYMISCEQTILGEARGEDVFKVITETVYVPIYWLHPVNLLTFPSELNWAEILEPVTRPLSSSTDKLLTEPARSPPPICRVVYGVQAARINNPVNNLKEIKNIFIVLFICLSFYCGYPFWLVHFY